MASQDHNQLEQIKVKTCEVFRFGATYTCIRDFTVHLFFQDIWANVYPDLYAEWRREYNQYALVMTLRPKQNGHLFADSIFKLIVLIDNGCTHGSGHETVAVLLPSFAINW